MPQIIECVPNFSDGRNPEVYHSIADSIRKVNGVRILDISADADHNRTVITYVGSPAAVEEAAFRAIARAAELIDLDEHTGEHPRIGATDVFPFIPIEGVTVEECVEIAHSLGQRVGEELGIAVYLYGRAASRPERIKLSAIRKGEYEQWKAEIATHPERQPDYGPAEPKPWGATVIGVRPFLIAYNLFLNSNDVTIAEKIARDIRFVSGGLRFVQAKGFLVEGLAQVSMNLTNFEKTPIHRVQELVRREASRYGVNVVKAELIGLIPRAALLDAAKWYLQLDDLRDEQVLEYRLEQEAAADLTPVTFLDAAAEATPTPGGGSVAALAGALAASLTKMVTGLTLGRKKYVDVEAEVGGIQSRVAELRSQLSGAINEDADAFDELMAAYRAKELDEAAKASAVEQATIKAGEVPLRVARLSLEVARLADKITEIGNVNAVTDVATAVIMARAAIQAAGLNVKINGLSLQDQLLAQSWREEVTSLEKEISALEDKTLATAAERGGF